MKVALKTFSYLALMFVISASVFAVNKQKTIPTKNLKPISEKNFISSEFGYVKAILYINKPYLIINLMIPESNILLTQIRMEFNEDYRDDLSNIEFYNFSINDDKKDDFLIVHTYPVGAGPQAGMDIIDYFAFISNGEGYIPFKKNDVAQKYINEYEIYDSVEIIKQLYSSLYSGRKINIPVGISISDENRAALNLLQNEKLILTFVMKRSHKRVTIAIDKNQKYLVYRYGAPGHVELTYKKHRNERKNKFRFIKEDNAGYQRYYIRNLIFTNNNYQYTVYDNYIESHITALDGTGIKIINTKTLETILIKGDEDSKQGKLDYLQTLKWIKVTKIMGNDYADE